MNGKARLYKSWAPGGADDYIFYGGAYYLGVLSMELASYHLPGA
jgi:hypothetical protein